MENSQEKLTKLKEDYEKLRKRHNLPSFKELNEDFQIEKAAETETEILVREVRRFVGDKLMNYMRFIESLLNPVNVPMFVFSIIKLIDAEEKKRLSEIYKKLMKKEVKFIELDLEFNEEKEAQFIKDSYEFWQEMKKDMLKVMDKINKRWDDKFEVNNRGYFG